MSFYYSPSQNQRYIKGVGNKLPDDAREITKELFSELASGELNGKVMQSDASGNPVLIDRAQPLPTAEIICQQIDAAADAARRAVAGDPLRAVEYDRAAAEAQAFKDAGYPSDSVPRTVAAWAIGGRTAQQAADNILVESAAYTASLYQIREARLGAKELVRQSMAAGNVDQAQDIAAETVASIKAAVAGVGNNT